MLNLLGRASEPTTDAQDKITYLTSVKFLLSVQTETPESVADQLRDLLASTPTRLDGLRFLEIALQQKPDIYSKGRWSALLIDILQEPIPILFKELSCKVLCIIIDILHKDLAGNLDDIKCLATSLFPYLILVTKDDIEWMEPAIQCLTAGVRSFPFAFESYKGDLLALILKQTRTASSKHFEALAECFSDLPACMKHLEPSNYQSSWFTQYSTALNTMHYLINHLFTFIPDEYRIQLEKCDTYDLDDTGSESLGSTFLHVRQFINMSKCVAKMLSSKSKYSVQIPIKATLECIGRLFPVEDIAKLKASSAENQMIISTLCQMQIAVLLLLEPLMLNFNLLPYSYYISGIMISALRVSSLSNLSYGTISQIHHVVWKLLNIWLGIHGAKAAFEIIRQQVIIKELLNDISIQDRNPQPSSSHALRGKSKRNAPAVVPKKNTYVNRNWHYVYKEALTALEQIFYCGATFLSKAMFEEAFSAVIQVARAIHPNQNPPFPYDNAKCREHLYSVLLAITLVCKPEQRSPIQSAIGIFSYAMRDPCIKVKMLSRRATATCRAFLHPRRALPLVNKDTDAKQKRSDNPSSMKKYLDWLPEDNYQNMPPVESVSNVSESLPSRVAQTFRNPNDTEMPSNDYIQVEARYSEQAEENQCNGEDILEIQSSSLCQEEESEEDEEEEEEDDRSYIEEEMNPEMDIPEEHIYIPSTSELQMITPVHTNPETVQMQSEGQEYEELRPATKTSTNVPDDSNSKNMQINGMRSIVPDEEMPSASTDNVANENGINGSEDEEMEEEEGDEDEEEEEHIYPAEKKVPEFFEMPAKKPKLETDVERKVEESDVTDQSSRSPTLAEMKADFCFSEVENVAS